MPAAGFAQELLDSIVDKVQERGTLKACSLAGRSLVVSSQRRLFRSICLFTAGPFLSSQPKSTHHLTGSLSSHGACDLFTMSPHLGSYVEELYIGLVLLQDYYVLESVLPAFQTIRHLGIFCDGNAFQWNTIPPSLAALLKDIALQPSVRSMSLEDIKGVPSSFILSPPFRMLSLHRVTIKEDISSASPYIPSQSYAGLSSSLERLAITPASLFYGKSVLEMDMHRHLKGIRKLSLLDIPFDDRHWMPFLLAPALRSTVQHLELSFRTTIPDLALPSFVALRQVEIRFEISNMRQLILDSALANFQITAPLLERLSLTLRLWTSASWDQKCDPCLSFASLDFKERFPALREVQCSLNPSTFRYEEGFDQYIGRIFPGPKEAGILRCSII